MISGIRPAYGGQAEAAMPLCMVTASGRAATTAASVGRMCRKPGGQPLRRSR